MFHAYNVWLKPASPAEVRGKSDWQGTWGKASQIIMGRASQVEHQRESITPAL